MRKIFALALCLLAAGCVSNRVTSANPASVTFRFRTDSNYAVLSFWRRIDPATGEKGSRFAVGQSAMSGIMNVARTVYSPWKEKLDPGTYYLDSFQFPVGSDKIYVSQGGHYMLRNGWDDKAGAPLYLSFSVREGQTLELPDVTVSSDKSESEPKALFKFDDPNKVFSVGARTNRAGRP